MNHVSGHSRHVTPFKGIDFYIAVFGPMFFFAAESQVATRII